MKDASCSFPSVYSGRRPRVLIADNHVLVAEAIRSHFQKQFEIVAVVHDSHQLLASAALLRPDVVILETSMDLMDGLEAGERIKARDREIKLVYLTTSQKTELVVEALRLGASGFVLKTDSLAGLNTAVHRALRGRTSVSPGIDTEECHRLVRCGKRLASQEITERQSEIVRMLARGMTLKEVGDQLGIKIGTVAFHKYKTMEKLGIKTSAGLFHCALTRLDRV